MNSYDLAFEILGKDFISPEEIMKSRKGITYTNEQLKYFIETIPAQKILEWCRDNNFMLVAGPNCPMSSLEIHDLNNDYFRSYGESCFTSQEFVKRDKAKTEWYMICKDIVPESTSNSWSHQLLLISYGNETVPNSAEFLWAITTYKAVRDIYLFGRINARTSSLDSYGLHVYIGGFSDEGLMVNYGLWDGNCNENLGLSVIRM